MKKNYIVETFGANKNEANTLIDFLQNIEGKDRYIRRCINNFIRNRHNNNYRCNKNRRYPYGFKLFRERSTNRSLSRNRQQTRAINNITTRNNTPLLHAPTKRKSTQEFDKHEREADNLTKIWIEKLT